MSNFDDILSHDKAMTAIDWAVDVVVALGAFGFGCLQLTLAVNLLVPDEALRRMLGIEAVVPTAYALALTVAPVVLRRRFPWPALVGSIAVWGLFQMQMGAVSLPLMGPLVAMFTLAYERPRSEAVAGFVLVVVVLALMPQLGSSWTLSSLTLMQNVAFVAAAGFAGYALRVRQEYVSAAEERAVEAERTRESEAQRRVEEERVRIAREVHDITAHSLSAVSIQAAAAERLIDSDPVAAKEAIASVRQTSKTALEEMRAMIGVLRSPDRAAQTEPTEGTDRLGDLASFLRDAGISCDIEDERYDRAIVPAFVDVALFGIAREASTNIVRHSSATYARIELSTTADGSGFAARLEVVDDGRALAAARRVSGGHGIEGMRERVNVLGGSFEAGPEPSGGFRVSAVVPFEGREGDRGER